MTKSILFTVFIATTALQSAARAAAECEPRILFLPQRHYDSDDASNAEMLERAGRSQFNITKFLARHRMPPVFSEQVDSDETLATVDESQRALGQEARQKFPNGWPESFVRASSNSSQRGY